MTYEKAADMFEGFNSLQDRKIFIFLEELGEQAELNKHEQQLKATVTAPHHKVTYKGVNSFQALNTIHLWAGCNPEKFAHMPVDERRIFAIKISDAHANDKKYFVPIFAEIANRDFIKSAFDYYSNMDLSDYNPSEVFVTQCKQKRKGEDKPLPLKCLEYYFTECEVKHDELLIFAEDFHKWYLAWAANVENVNTKMTLSAHKEFMTKFGLTPTRISIDDKRKVGYKATKAEVEKLMKTYMKNPAYTF